MMMIRKMKKVSDPHIPPPTKNMMPLMDKKKRMTRSDCYFQLFPLPPYSDKLPLALLISLVITKHSLM